MKKYILLILASVPFLNSSLACEGVERVITDNDFKVDTLEFTAEGSKKLVFILPPTGGINIIDKSYAKALCKSNINAVIVKNWTDDDEHSLELEIHTRFYNRAQRAMGILIKKYHNFELGVLGTSVGGLHASISLARFDQLKIGLFIVSGGNIASIITDSNQKVLVDAKKKRFAFFNFKSDREYQNALEKVIPYEPLRIKFDRVQKKIGMIISTNDDTVPTKNQLELQEKWNPIILSSSGLGHKATVVKTWLFLKSDIVEFFH